MTVAVNGRMLIVAAAIFICAAVVAAVYIEPPQVARQKRLDERRVRDLSSLEGKLNEYWNRQKKLPLSLDELPAAGLDAADRDPETLLSYQYAPTSATSYRVCAIFALASGESASRAWPAQRVEWAHGRGKQCFERMVRQTSG